MKHTLEYYISKDESFRQILLNQDGGIMKYWAEHPNSDFDIDLFDGYENEIVKAYLQANKRNRAVRSLTKDELRRKSIDWYQSKESELKFFVVMKPALNAFNEEVSEQVLNYIEIYMTDVYKESHRCKYPEGMSPQDFYKEVLEIYGPWGLALDCLERVLQECRGKAVRLTAKHFFQIVIAHQGESSKWEEINNLQAEFAMKMFKETFYAEGSYKKLRQAVKEMINNNTLNLTEEEKRKLCREMAKDEMRKVNHFTRWVNNESYPIEKSEGGKLVPLITPEERHWLQNIMYENSPGATGTQKLTPMGRYYSDFIYILQHIGSIWAAQLLVHGIDMKELEKETGIILSKLSGSMYYMDRDIDDQRGDCCVYDWAEAKKLLDIIKSKKPIRIKEISWEDEKQCFKNAVLRVLELKRKRDGGYLFEESTQWKAVYRFAVDFGIMYDKEDPREPHDKSTPQYALFNNFAHELQLDVNPPTRLPFKLSYIDSMNKALYARFREPYPWSTEGLKKPSKGFTLYRELSGVYKALEDMFFYLVQKASMVMD